MMNKVFETGRLTKDPDVTKVGDKKKFTCARFSIAVDRPKRKGQEKETDFFNCVAWYGTGDFIAEHFKKGDLITVVGKLRSDSWVKDNAKHYSTFIVVDEAHFAGSKKVKDGKNESEVEGHVNNSDDELPM